MAAHALIIEDDIDSIAVLGRMLNNEGIDYVAISEPNSITRADLDEVSVVFLDLDMPGMNGYEVFELLHDQYQLHAPIVAYTVNTNEKSTTRRKGFTGMFAKPLESSCFADQLNRLLSGETIWDDC